jgi:hypothetical protein
MNVVIDQPRWIDVVESTSYEVSGLLTQILGEFFRFALERSTDLVN